MKWLKDLSFQKKVLWLTAMLAANFIILGCIASYTLSKSRTDLINVGYTQMPAVRLMTLADMMHDGIRAVVFRGFLVEQQHDTKELANVKNELTEFENNISKHIEDLKKLDLPLSTKTLIEASEPNIKTYIDKSSEMMNLLTSGKSKQALAQMENYEEVFKKLEKDFEVLGEKIEKDAQFNVDTASSKTKNFLYFQIIFSIGCVIIGSLVTRYFLKQINIDLQFTANEIQNVSQASNQISNQVSSVATAMVQMGASIKEISSSASEAARVAQTAVRSSSITSEQVQRLKESSMQVGKVVNLINQIAEQTNLLALNASIEAARAGDAGRGFTVVANEVKELAKQTAHSTEEITNKIEAIQDETNRMVISISEVTNIINNISDLQTVIASATEEQNATNGEIARSISKVANGTSEITEKIHAVEKLVSSTSRAA